MPGWRCALNIEQVLDRLMAEGVSVWLDDLGKLRVDNNAPPELKDLVREHKQELIDVRQAQSLMNRAGTRIIRLPLGHFAVACPLGANLDEIRWAMHVLRMDPMPLVINDEGLRWISYDEWLRQRLLMPIQKSRKGRLGVNTAEIRFRTAEVAKLADVSSAPTPGLGGEEGRDGIPRGPGSIVHCVAGFVRRCPGRTPPTGSVVSATPPPFGCTRGRRSKITALMSCTPTLRIHPNRRTPGPVRRLSKQNPSNLFQTFSGQLCASTSLIVLIELIRRNLWNSELQLRCSIGANSNQAERWTIACGSLCSDLSRRTMKPSRAPGRS